MSRSTPVRRVFSGRLRLIGSAIFIALLTLFPAQASLLWNWTYTGDGIAAGGTFTTDDAPDSSGYYHITGITGSRNGVAITRLEPAGEAIPGNPGFPVDNLVTAGGLLTSHGFGFATADGNHANPFYADFQAPPRFLEVFTQPASMGFSELPIQFTAAIVPEPGTLALVATALVGLAAAGRRRRPYSTDLKTTI
jgi:PEP-CTERM motif